MLGEDQSRIWIRYFAFLAISIAIIVVNLYVASLRSQRNQNQVPDETVVAKADAKTAQGKAEGKKGEATPRDVTKNGAGGVPSAQAEPPKKVPTPETPKATPAGEEKTSPSATSPQAKPKLEPAPLRYVTLGSLQPDGPYRMLITLSSQGASVACLEMSSLRYCDTEQWGGYLGEIAPEAQPGQAGVQVVVVGPGTPAAEAGLLPGDVITHVNGEQVADRRSLDAILDKCRPKHEIRLTVQRGKKNIELTTVLRRPPLKLIRREPDSPNSFEMTLAAVGANRLGEVRSAIEERIAQANDALAKEALYLQWLYAELPGVRMRGENWHILGKLADPTRPETWSDSDAGAEPSEPRDAVTFGLYLPESKLAILKTYRLKKVDPKEIKDADDPNYHFTLDIEVINVGDAPTQVAYQLDGPNGLPTEGAWYARKMSNSWGAVGLRDVALRLGTGSVRLVSCSSIVRDKWGAPWKDGAEFITALGVDAQYFSVILLPQKSHPEDVWFDEARPIRVGAVEPDYEYLTNVSCRMTSTLTTLHPGDRLQHQYLVFAGPKRESLLARYKLAGLIQYGWFWFVAGPMTQLLHFFYNYLVFNYGLAIILLTVVVRLALFPISRKQALSAQKMQELQPEIRKIQEKYKDIQERNRATQQLFRQHNYNPFSGCLVLFIQLPIFIGLYKALAIDVELRQAPLISEAIRWCSNLAAPDMFWNWSFLWPEWFNRGNGMFALGPYLNLLPILTIVIFLWQQKKMMPPPADEQAAMQQKVMNFMMIFMGILFYKVPSGLCLYFIASSLWGMAERSILLKATQKRPGAASPRRPRRSPWKNVRVPNWLRQLLVAADKDKAQKVARRRTPVAKR